MVEHKRPRLEGFHGLIEETIVMRRQSDGCRVDSCGYQLIKEKEIGLDNNTVSCFLSSEGLDYSETKEAGWSTSLFTTIEEQEILR